MTKEQDYIKNWTPDYVIQGEGEFYGKGKVEIMLFEYGQHKVKDLNDLAISAHTFSQKSIWVDHYLNHFKWYRKYRKLTWYQHEFTPDALQLSVNFVGTFWALYGEINRYSKVIEIENCKKK